MKKREKKMRHRLNIYFLVSIFFVLFLSGLCFAADDGDFQYWNTESVSWKANDDLKLKLEEEFRFGNNAGTLYYQHSDLGFTYSGFAPWLDIGLNYRQIFEESGTNWLSENRPHFNLTLKQKAFDWVLSNRFRFEYRNREEKENYFRYRNKFSIKTPFKLTKFNIQPYIADEIFYDFNIETLNRNRLYAGFGFQLFKQLKADIFYLWETTEKSEKWNDVHVLGTKLGFSF